MISRRTFIATVTGGLLSVPLAAGAQRAESLHRIGWLSSTTPANGLTNLNALRAGLRDLGYIEGQNITIEARWADGRVERLPQLAAELVHLPVRVLCTAGGQAAGAAKQATSTIPIVFANVAFPEQSGLVASYSRPGGNMTGVAFIGPEYGKRLELLREASPKLSRVALIYNPDNPGSVLALQETQRWATTLGVKLEPHRLLSMYPTQEFVDAGGLMFYGSSIPDMYRHAAACVDRILKGAKPGDLPVEQPRKFDMVINLKTAKALGLTMPGSLRLRADRVIE